MALIFFFTELHYLEHINFKLRYTYL